MIKTIKWEALKRFHQVKWLLAILIFALLMLCVIPASKTDLSFYPYILLMAVFEVIIVLGVILFCLCYPIMIMVIDYLGACQFMERATDNRYFKVLFAKLIMNFCSFLFGSSIGYLGVEIMKRFATKTSSYLNINLSQPYLLVMFSMVLICPLIVSFCFFLTSSINIFKNHRILGTVLFAAIFLGIYILFSSLPNAVLYIASIPIIIAAGVGSCLVADHNYEPS